MNQLEHWKEKVSGGGETVSWSVERGPEADVPLRAPERPSERTSGVTPSPSTSEIISSYTSSQELTPFDVAQHFYGIRERLPDGTPNPMIEEFFDSTWWEEGDGGDAWCSAFVNYCVEQAGLEGTNSPRARSWLEWGQRKAVEDVERGDILVFSRGRDTMLGHVGFYFDKTPGGSLLVYGGNQSNSVTVSRYNKSRLLSVREPAVPIDFELTYSGVRHNN